MAISFLNSPHNPLNFHKFKKTPNPEKSKKINPQNQTNLKSFWAFLSSVFIYISVFYTFNLSPSTLFCTTLFWFLMLNTLVFIIAADYISFSTSSKSHDFYDEYVEKSSKSTFDDKIFEKTKISNRTINEEVKTTRWEVNNTSLDLHLTGLMSQRNDGERFSPLPQQNNYEEEKTNETIVNMVDPEPNPVQESNEKIINMVEPDPNPGPVRSPVQEPPGEKKEEKSGRKCSRSKSDVVASAAVEEGEGKLVLQRAFSERHEYEKDDENEFSRMSDEELNWRVEEFIRRFNRQIRLQAVRTN